MAISKMARKRLHANASSGSLVVAEINATPGGLLSNGAVGAISHTRNSTCWLPDDAGVLRQFAANVPAINRLGVLIEPARTNYCACYNAAPDTGLTGVSVSGGTLSRVDDGPALQRAGLGVICPRYAFSFANSTGLEQTITISGQSGNTNAAAISCWAYATGEGAILQLTAGQGAVPIQVGTDYAYIYSESIAHTGTDQLQIVVPAGAAITFVLPQFETAIAGSAQCSASSPIIVSGSSAIRNATVLSVPISYWPKQSTIAVEFTPQSSEQDNDSAYVFDGYIDTNNSYRIVGYQGHKKVAGTSVYSVARGLWSRGLTARAALRATDNSVDLIWNGIRPMTSPAPAVQSATSATLYIGRKQDGSQQITGQIKRITIASAGSNDQHAVTLTDVVDPMQSLGELGIPFYGPDGAIWALRWDSTAAKYTDVVRSADWGDTWEPVHTLGGFATGAGTLYVDKSLNCYFLSNGTGGLKRIDGASGVITDAITWQPGSGRSYSWLSWHMTEDDQGYLYTTAYSLTGPGDGSSAPGTGNQYIYISPPGGNSFTANNQLVTGYPNSRHVHSIHCSPYDNKVYVSFGDGNDRSTVVSADRFATAATQITDATGEQKGPTGLTFTSECPWVSTDVVGNQNYLERVVDGSIEWAWKPRSPVHTSPLYFVRACGNNEIWLTAINEASGSARVSALIKLIKSSGATSPWRIAWSSLRWDARLDLQEFYELSHNGRGIIPDDAPFVFASLKRSAAAGAQAPVEIFRVAR